MIVPQIKYERPVKNVDNPDFSLGAQGWQTQPGWSIVAGDGSGNHLGGTSVWHGLFTNTTQSPLTSATVSTSRYRCKPGDQVTAGMWVFLSAATTGLARVAVRVVWTLSDGSDLPIDGPFIRTSGWTHTFSSAVAPANAVYVHMDVAAFGIPPGVSVQASDASLSGAHISETLSFRYPPTTKPRFNQKAVRQDTFSTGGVRQTVLQRVNDVQPIQMKNIMRGRDADSWAKFLAVAVTGVPFTYYPDESNSHDSSVCFLVETDAQLTFVSSGIYSFTGNFQKEIA